MAIDIKLERLVTFIEAAHHIPRRRLGRPTHPATVWRWAKKGVNANGRRVFLDAVKLPSGGATTLEALQRFLDEINGEASRPVQAGGNDDLSCGIEELDADNV